MLFELFKLFLKKGVHKKNKKKQGAVAELLTPVV